MLARIGADGPVDAGDFPDPQVGVHAGEGLSGPGVLADVVGPQPGDVGEQVGEELGGAVLRQSADRRGKDIDERADNLRLAGLRVDRGTGLRNGERHRRGRGGEQRLGQRVPGVGGDRGIAVVGTVPEFAAEHRMDGRLVVGAVGQCLSDGGVDHLDLFVVGDGLRVGHVRIGGSDEGIDRGDPLVVVETGLGDDRGLVQSLAEDGVGEVQHGGQVVPAAEGRGGGDRGDPAEGTGRLIRTEEPARLVGFQRQSETAQ